MNDSLENQHPEEFTGEWSLDKVKRLLTENPNGYWFLSVPNEAAGGYEPFEPDAEYFGDVNGLKKQVNAYSQTLVSSADALVADGIKRNQIEFVVLKTETDEVPGFTLDN